MARSRRHCSLASPHASVEEWVLYWVHGPPQSTRSARNLGRHCGAGAPGYRRPSFGHPLLCGQIRSSAEAESATFISLQRFCYAPRQVLSRLGSAGPYCAPSSSACSSSRARVQSAMHAGANVRTRVSFVDKSEHECPFMCGCCVLKKCAGIGQRDLLEASTVVSGPYAALRVERARNAPVLFFS